jgi:hypothetical protein
MGQGLACGDKARTAALTSAASATGSFTYRARNAPAMSSVADASSRRDGGDVSIASA